MEQRPSVPSTGRRRRGRRLADGRRGSGRAYPCGPTCEAKEWRPDQGTTDRAVQGNKRWPTLPLPRGTVTLMRMSDEEAAEYYRQPDHQEPSSAPARRRSTPGLSEHVPIRFRPDVIANVRILAANDQKTVSTWIRDVVEREVDRRLPPSSKSGAFRPTAFRLVDPRASYSKATTARPFQPAS